MKVPTFATLQPNIMRSFQSRMPDSVGQPSTSHYFSYSVWSPGTGRQETMLISFFFLKPDYPWDSWEEQESRDLFETSETNASSLLNQHGFLPKVGNGEKQYTHIEDLTFFFFFWGDGRSGVYSEKNNLLTEWGLFFSACCELWSRLLDRETDSPCWREEEGVQDLVSNTNQPQHNITPQSSMEAHT